MQVPGARREAIKKSGMACACAGGECQGGARPTGGTLRSLGMASGAPGCRVPLDRTRAPCAPARIKRMRIRARTDRRSTTFQADLFHHGTPRGPNGLQSLRGHRAGGGYKSLKALEIDRPEAPAPHYHGSASHTARSSRAGAHRHASDECPGAGGTLRHHNVQLQASAGQRHASESPRQPRGRQHGACSLSTSAMSSRACSAAKRRSSSLGRRPPQAAGARARPRRARHSRPGPCTRHGPERAARSAG
jgi:hypothetical protein